MIQFLSDDLWNTIKSVSKRSKRTKAAVAYFGKGAADQLSLKKGDTLLVAMSLSNVSSGQVSPDDIQKLYDKGVSIYNLGNLHAKVYLFDNTAIIGSANVSNHSANYLLEGAVLTNEKKVLRDVDRFISDHCNERVDQDYIELCKSYYNPPKYPERQQRKLSRNTAEQLSPLWVISIHPLEFDKDDEVEIKKKLGKYEKKRSHNPRFELSQLRYSSTHRFIRNVRAGDILIQIFRHGTRTQVLAPTRALGVEVNSKKRRAYVWIEDRKQTQKRSWTDFEKYLRRNTVTGITMLSTRKIKDESMKKVLLRGF
jgi:hypothetical protein